jgi:methylmalonyl-CoA/ethylmalonyl-CoA epimerase
MLDIQLDHVAIGAQSIADAEPFLEGTLAGTKSGGFASGPPFGFMQWVYAGGGRIEVIYPIGADGFLHRFLARGGPRVHHVTFKVSSLDAMLERAGAMNHGIASQDRSDPYWQEAFLHPKQAQGLVIQLVEHHPRPEPHDDPANGTPLPHAARAIGPRLVAPSETAARRQWEQLLGGRVTHDGDTLAFSWPRSPLRITVDVDANAEPGPRCIEVAAPRPLALPGGAVPKLGTRFVQVLIGV